MDTSPVIVVTMCHYCRPDYTIQSLKALANCDGIADTRVIAVVDFYNKNKPVRDAVAGEVLSANKYLPKVSPVICGSNIGVNEATKLAVRQGFLLGADFVVHVEDDVVLAPDALTFFRHCATQYRDDPTVFSVTAYNRVYERPDPSTWHRLETRQWFHGWAFGIWRDRWEACLTDWPTPKLGWDIHINERVRRHQGERCLEVFPSLSRCQNIGAVTSFPGRFTPQWHAENQHAPFWAGNETVPSGEFA